MFYHFDMTFNIGVDYILKSLLHDCLFKHVLACNLESMYIYSPLLGWLNDEHCTLNNISKSFTYMFKLGHKNFGLHFACLIDLAFLLIFMSSKIYAIYIYAAYTLYFYFPNILGMSFSWSTEELESKMTQMQEGRGDDEDITTKNMTTTSTFSIFV